jgi:RNA polymerase sigma-70 factor (ECF subfamily)
MTPPVSTPPGPHDERRLIRKARNGDRAAFGALYRQYASMVHGLLLARVPPDVADDLLQEVFLKAMIQLNQLRDDDHFGAWIAAIARNRAVDHHRHAREIQSSEGLLELLSMEPNYSLLSEAQLALTVIRSLPDAYRETLTMRLAEGLSGPEIAVLTGLTPESVRVNLHRGMKLLRERLRQVDRPVGKRSAHE